MFTHNIYNMLFLSCAEKICNERANLHLFDVLCTTSSSILKPLRCISNFNGILSSNLGAFFFFFFFFCVHLNKTADLNIKITSKLKQACYIFKTVLIIKIFFFFCMMWWKEGWNKWTLTDKTASCGYVIHYIGMVHLSSQHEKIAFPLLIPYLSLVSQWCLCLKILCTWSVHILLLQV